MGGPVPVLAAHTRSIGGNTHPTCLDSGLLHMTLAVRVVDSWCAPDWSQAPTHVQWALEGGMLREAGTATASSHLSGRQGPEALSENMADPEID